MHNKEKMESPFLVFELQWKNNPGEKTASIGIWDKEDTSLDWTRFKSYLGQNMGTVDDISVAYVDSEGDELPIDSECEFQEALKFARQRARTQREIVLKVDRVASSQVNTIANGEKVIKKDSLKHYCKKKKSVKHPGKCASLLSSTTSKTGGNICACLERDRVPNMLMWNEWSNKTAPQVRYGSAAEEEAPVWFKKSLKKFKLEMIEEMNIAITQAVHQALNEERKNSKTGNDAKHAGEQGKATATTLNKQKKKDKKKKSSDEDSSDGNLTNERDIKLLKKIEKLHRSGEKKFEKLDSKMERLEHKTKRLLEKKSYSKLKKDKVIEAVDKMISLRKRSNDISVATYLMDAMLLNGPCKEIYTEPGAYFVKVWQVMNNGTLPWTDKTELCLAWGTPGLRFEKQTIKCPQLEPGETDQISVRAQAPDYPGTFESYWHFHHMGDRFGHWIDCAVVVGFQGIRPTHQACENTRPAVYFNQPRGSATKIYTGSQKLAKKIHPTVQTFVMSSPKSKERLTPQPAESPNTPLGSDQCNSNNSMASDTVRENQRKIAENMVEIQKRLDDISLLHTPPNADKILEMAFGDNFPCCKKDLLGEGIDDNDEHIIDMNSVPEENIEPSEWKEVMMMPPKFLESEDEERNDKRMAENFCTLKRDFLQHLCEHKNDVNDLLIDFSYGDNNLNKPAEVSELFTKNIQEEENEEAKIENGDNAEEKDGEYESDSDSELSVISTFSTSSESEGDDNFIVVPMPSGSHGSECKMCQSITELDDTQEIKTVTDVESETATAINVENLTFSKTDNAEAVQVKEKSSEKSHTAADSSNETTENNPESAADKEAKKSEIHTIDSSGNVIYAVTSNGYCFPVESLLKTHFKHAPVVRNRRTRFGEYDKNESKTKKLKSSRQSEYHFNASQLSDKTFCPYTAMDDSFKKRRPPTSGFAYSYGAPPTFTFTAKNSENRPFCSNCSNKQEERRDKNGNTGRRFNNIRVDRHGYVHHPHNFAGSYGSQIGQDMNVPSVDILPNSLMHGAINVASSAINTARSVINNLHSAFLPEGEVGAKRPANQNKADSFSREAMYRLYEMGFTDVQKNRKLLIIHDNDVSKVIEELVHLNLDDSPPSRSN